MDTKATRLCEVCQENIPSEDIASAPCSHGYCRNCLEIFFKTSMTDESLFPPRCCDQPIMLENVSNYLKPELVSDFEKKQVEFETMNRTYCHNSTCGAFIAPDCIFGEEAKCLACHSETCTKCKAEAHEGDCPTGPDDSELQQVLETAKENGWKRCYSCTRVVERNGGCYHITCVCKAQFCYLCEAKWKTCACVMMPARDGNEVEERDFIPLLLDFEPAQNEAIDRAWADFNEFLLLLDQERQQVIRDRRLREEGSQRRWEAWRWAAQLLDEARVRRERELEANARADRQVLGEYLSYNPPQIQGFPFPAQYQPLQIFQHPVDHRTPMPMPAQLSQRPVQEREPPLFPRPPPPPRPHPLLQPTQEIRAPFPELVLPMPRHRPPLFQFPSSQEAEARPRLQTMNRESESWRGARL